MLDGRKVEISTKEGFSILPADKYTVQIADVNLKTKLKFKSTEEEEVLEYKFQILDDNEMQEEGETTRGRFLWSSVRPSLNSRSNLGKLVRAVMGRELTKEESDSFDPESIVGSQIDVMVEQRQSQKDATVVYNNIISFNKASKKLDPIPVEKQESQPIQKTTRAAIPATAPDAEAEAFTAGLENTGSGVAEAEAEAAELEAAALAAKAKAAAARAKALSGK